MYCFANLLIMDFLMLGKYAVWFHIWCIVTVLSKQWYVHCIPCWILLWLPNYVVGIHIQLLCLWIIVWFEGFQVLQCLALLSEQALIHSVADPEGGCGGTVPSKICQNLAKLTNFLPILASMPPTWPPWIHPWHSYPRGGYLFKNHNLQKPLSIEIIKIRMSLLVGHQVKSWPVVICRFCSVPTKAKRIILQRTGEKTKLKNNTKSKPTPRRL